MTGDHSDLGQALEFIDPATLGYQEWLEVGMALHESGLPCELWDSWSKRDPGRYHEGECARKWEGFGSGDGRVTGATVARMARDRGWVPEREGPGTALAWDGEVDVSGIVDPAWVEPEEIPDGPSDPVRELSAYLSALFGAEEVVGYVCESLERDGRHIPANKGTYTRTCGELLRDLERYGSIERALGSYDPAAGAWVRFNPLNGQGVRNSDVADFRYALVESDSLPKDRQLALVRALELPCAAIVDSGGKSVHAIVRVDARDYAEYRQRVDQLYEVCRKNGLEPDPQNKNPSRLSRMPGAVRGGSQQRLLSGPCGRATWAEWGEWVQEPSDDLPAPDNRASVWGDMPELAPPLIEGVLRQGHKMMLAGPSKAGKSFALIELCCAIAEGREWLGRRCAQGRVLYVNLELDPASALRRFRDVYDDLGWEPANVSNIDVWNLRGRAVPMDRLAPSLIRRALRVRPIAIVIDPIYKVITGDENSADQMAAFCNQFDRVAQQVGCAVIYCHHHSKGFQGNKRSMDRASGSGVFARDTDALLDMAPLELTDACREERSSRLRWAAAEAFLSRELPDWRDRVPADEQGSVEALLTWSTRGMPRAQSEALRGREGRVEGLLVVDGVEDRGDPARVPRLPARERVVLLPGAPRRRHRRARGPLAGGRARDHDREAQARHGEDQEPGQGRAEGEGPHDARRHRVAQGGRRGPDPGGRARPHRDPRGRHRHQEPDRELDEGRRRVEPHQGRPRRVQRPLRHIRLCTNLRRRGVIRRGLVRARIPSPYGGR